MAVRLVDCSLRENLRITVVEALEQGLEASVGEVFTKVGVLEWMHYMRSENHQPAILVLRGNTWSVA